LRIPAIAARTSNDRFPPFCDIPVGSVVRTEMTTIPCLSGKQSIKSSFSEKNDMRSGKVHEEIRRKAAQNVKRANRRGP